MPLLSGLWTKKEVMHKFGFSAVRGDEIAKDRRSRIIVMDSLTFYSSFAAGSFSCDLGNSVPPVEIPAIPAIHRTTDSTFRLTLS